MRSSIRSLADTDVNGKRLAGGSVNCCRYRDLVKYKNGDIAKRDIEKRDVGGCCNYAAFKKAHAHQLAKLATVFSKFETAIQIALIQWFVGRDHCGYRLATLGSTC